MAKVAHLYRHPIKAIGVEEIGAVALSSGKTMPLDRVWAVAHEAAKVSPGIGDWARCLNFVRGASSPGLMAVRVRVNGDETLTLTHPERPDLTLDPESQGAALVDWVRPICDPNRAAPSFVYRADTGITDSSWASVSILGLGSLEALGGRLGKPLSPLRFRGNVWVDGLDSWEEFSWVGKTLRIGEVEFEVRERIERCTATTVDPETGKPDADTLGALEEGWGHRDLGVKAVVTKGGRIATGDAVELT